MSVHSLPDPRPVCPRHPADWAVLCDPAVLRAVDPVFVAFRDVAHLDQALQFQVERQHPLAELLFLELPQCSPAVMALVSVLVHGRRVTVSDRHPAARPVCVALHQSDGLECSGPEIFAPDDPLRCFPRRPHDRDR